jgi:hypothetical protein
MRWNSRVPEVENGVTSEQLLQPETRRKYLMKNSRKFLGIIPKQRIIHYTNLSGDEKNRCANGDPETQTRGRKN